MTKIAYIDGSGSTGNRRKWFDSLGMLYQTMGWQVYDFSTKVTPWTYGTFQGGGTRSRAVLEHLTQRVRAGSDINAPVTDVVVITDDYSASFDLDRFSSFRPVVVTVQTQEQYAAAFTHAGQRGPWVPALAQAIQQQGKTAFFDEVFSASTNVKDIFGPIDIHKYLNPSRPQEAHVNARPTIVTTVSLDRSRATEQPTIGDLKTLIAEVERVGGDDSSLVRLDQDSYRWNVTLSVKANEIEAEVTLSPEQENLLLAEYRTSGTTKSRKAEIKTLLGL